MTWLKLFSATEFDGTAQLQALLLSPICLKKILAFSLSSFSFWLFVKAVCKEGLERNKQTIQIKNKKHLKTKNEPPHDKTNKMVCAPSEDSDPPSLIRVFAVRMKKAWILSYPLSAQRRLIRLGGCPGWSESSLGAQSFVCFVMRRLNIIHRTTTTFKVSILLNICLASKFYMCLGGFLALVDSNRRQSYIALSW